MNRGWGTRPGLVQGIRGRRQSGGGYTIVESMIFLMVTGAMVLMVMTLISGQQGKTQFQQSVREFEVTLQDLANDVSTGYPSVELAGKSCEFSGGGDNAAVTSFTPSANNRCIFVGRGVQFGVAGENTKYAVYGVVGRQRLATGKEVTNLTEAKAQVLNITDDVRDFGAMTIKSVTFDNSPDYTSPNMGTIGFFTTFQQYGSGGLESGASVVDLVGIAGTRAITDDTAAAKLALKTQIWPLPNPSLDKVTNPKNGITLCLDSESSNQHAVMTIGGGVAGQFSVASVISGGSCP